MGTRFTAGATQRIRVAQQSVGPLEGFLIRLKRLGATQDELDGVREAWNEPDGWVMPKAQLIALADSQLVSMLSGARTEYELHTTDEEDDRLKAAEARLRSWELAIAQYEGLTFHGPLKITEVRQWVGTDLDRASAAREAELKAAEPRKTLVAFLEQLLVGD